MKTLNTHQGMELMTSPTPGFAQLVKVAKDILHIVQGTDKRAWADLGKYAHEVICQLNFVLGDGELTCDEALINKTKKLKSTLDKIHRKVSTMQDRPLAYRLIGFLTDEYCIADLRRELDDGLNLFQVSALASMSEDIREILSRVKQHYPGSESKPLEYMKADRVSMFNRSPSVSFWGNIPLDEPSADGIQIERTTQTGSIGQTPYGGTESIAFLPGLKRPSFEEMITFALETVEADRLLAQEHPEHWVTLARSLQHLSVLLAEDGQLEQAVLTCQEALGLYRALVEKPPTLPGKIALSVEDGLLIENKAPEPPGQMEEDVEKGAPSEINGLI